MDKRKIQKRVKYVQTDYYDFLNSNENLSRFKNPQKTQLEVAAVSPISFVNPQDVHDRKAKATLEAMAADFVQKNGLKIASFGVCVNLMGIPEEHSLTKHMGDYVEKAIEFMHQEVKGLTPLEQEIVVFNAGESHGHNYKKKIFIGKGYTRLYTGAGKTTKGEKLSLMMPVIQQSSFLVPLSVSENGLDQWVAYLSSGGSALFALFSELLGVSCIRKNDWLRSQNPMYRAQLIEAITESMSCELAGSLQQSGRLPIVVLPDNLTLDKIHSMATKMDVHGLVEPGKRLLRKEGLQAAYDMWVENPSKYAAELEKY